MHHQTQLADLVDVLAVDFDIVDRPGDKTRPEALGGRLEGKPNPKDSVSQHSPSLWASSASGNQHKVAATLRCLAQGSRHTPLCRPPGYDLNLIKYGGRHNKPSLRSTVIESLAQVA